MRMLTALRKSVVRLGNGAVAGGRMAPRLKPVLFQVPKKQTEQQTNKPKKEVVQEEVETVEGGKVVQLEFCNVFAGDPFAKNMPDKEYPDWLWKIKFGSAKLTDFQRPKDVVDLDEKGRKHFFRSVRKTLIKRSNIKDGDPIPEDWNR